jgi:hypothetical protein
MTPHMRVALLVPFVASAAIAAMYVVAAIVMLIGDSSPHLAANFQLSAMLGISSPRLIYFYEAAIVDTLSLFLLASFLRSIWQTVPTALLASTAFAFVAMNAVSVTVSIGRGNSASFYEHYIGEILSILFFSAAGVLALTAPHLWFNQRQIDFAQADKSSGM